MAVCERNDHMHTESASSDELRALVVEIQDDIDARVAAHDPSLYPADAIGELVDTRDEITAELARRDECGATFS